MLFGVFMVHAQKNMDAFEVQVDGLGCPFCAYGLEKKFKEFKGIKKVEINIETGDFSFLYPTEKALSMTAVITQVKKAGYTPNNASVTRANGAIETSGDTVTILTEDSIVVNKEVLVAGRCEMCKARVERMSLEIPGVTTAVWNLENQQLTVAFDKNQTSVDAIQKVMAKAGHDTAAHLATTKAYDNLPACCHYQRLEL